MQCMASRLIEEIVTAKPSRRKSDRFARPEETVYLCSIVKQIDMEKIHYIREIMQLKGLNIQQLADIMGVSRASVSATITKDLRMSTAKRIADALEVSLSELFVAPKRAGKSADEETHPLSANCPHCGEPIEFTVTAE